MVRHHSVEELEQLLASDLIAFAETLARGPAFPIFEFVEVLQRRPELAALVRSRLVDYRLETYDMWMSRRILPLRSRDLTAFCRLATEVVREHHPDFAVLPDALPPVVASFLIASIRRADYRDRDGHGWEIELEEADEGPAEVIHVEHWKAQAHGPGFLHVIHLDSVQASVEVWADPIRDPTQSDD